MTNTTNVVKTNVIMTNAAAPSLHLLSNVSATSPLLRYNQTVALKKQYIAV